MAPTRQPFAGLPALQVLAQAPDANSREQLLEIQRARILAAMVDVCSRFGVGNATVARVVARSGISRRTFYEIFEDREGCFLAAFDEAIDRLAAVVIPAHDAPRSWSAKMRTALAAILELLEHDRETARLLVVETLGAGPKALARRQRVIDQIVLAVDQGRSESKHGEALQPLAAEGVVGGAFSLIHSRLLDGKGDELTVLLNPLMSMIVLPYLGSAAARKELTRAMPEANERTRSSGADPLRDLEMRLTYRTVRVLLAVGAHPGASNRQIADASDIRDQGQISKLLARLEDLGLTQNLADGRVKGEPNRWTLTPRGVEVQGAISP